jgi:hypothetical protein
VQVADNFQIIVTTYCETLLATKWDSQLVRLFPVLARDKAAICRQPCGQQLTAKSMFFTF